MLNSTKHALDWIQIDGCSFNLIQTFSMHRAADCIIAYMMSKVAGVPNIVAIKRVCARVHAFFPPRMQARGQ